MSSRGHAWALGTVLGWVAAWGVFFGSVAGGWWDPEPVFMRAFGYGVVLLGAVSLAVVGGIVGAVVWSAWAWCYRRWGGGGG